MRVDSRKLVIAMFDSGLNQKQLAELSNVSRATINSIKNGRSCSDETGHKMLMYGKEASNRKQEIDRQHYTIPNQRPKDKHCGKI